MKVWMDEMGSKGKRRDEKEMEEKGWDCKGIESEGNGRDWDGIWYKVDNVRRWRSWRDRRWRDGLGRVEKGWMSWE
jgi:hypothetical protein